MLALVVVVAEIALPYFVGQADQMFLLYTLSIYALVHGTGFGRALRFTARKVLNDSL